VPRVETNELEKWKTRKSLFVGLVRDLISLKLVPLQQLPAIMRSKVSKTPIAQGSFKILLVIARNVGL
jgi:hypothetical protein